MPSKNDSTNTASTKITRETATSPATSTTRKFDKNQPSASAVEPTNAHTPATTRKFDKRKFLRDAKSIVLIALFVFLLASINLFAKTNDQILSASSMEMSGYLGYYNDKYDEGANNAQNANDEANAQNSQGANGEGANSTQNAGAEQNDQGANGEGTAQGANSSQNVSINEDLKAIEANLEGDKDAIYEKQFFILNKDSGDIIATSDVPARVSDELNSQINEKMIVIDGHTCKVVDFDHYKMLVKVNTLAEFEEFANSVGNFSLMALLTLAIALVLTALGQLIPNSREKLRLGANIAITLIIVCTFALEVLDAEMSQFDKISKMSEETLQQDLEVVCNDSPLSQNITKEDIEAIGNSLASASMTLKGVTFTGDESKLAGFATATGATANDPASAATATGATASDPAGTTTAAGATTSDLTGSTTATTSSTTTATTKINASQDIQIEQDDNKIQNEKTSFYIQAALLLLLAFMLAKETRDRAVAATQAKKTGAADLTENDKKIRTALLLIGLASACFGIVNVLRIRQVVMANWTDNVSAIISIIFTATMVATIIGSIISSTLLKKCGSVKTFIIVTCALGIAGSIACCISNNVLIFVAGLLIYNLAYTTSRMSDDFYITLIDDAGRKDRCGVEFNAAKGIGTVVGTIAGGIVSEVVSFAFVQMVTGVLFLLIVLYAMRFNGADFKTCGSKSSIKDTISCVGTAVKKPRLLLFMVCVVMVGSLPYMLIQYKLPLDIAALGFSAVVLSFIKTAQEMVEIYARPLYHIISRRLTPVMHAALYMVVSGIIMIFYMLSGGSIVMIAISIACIGLADSAGQYSVTKSFREHPDLTDVPESDRIVMLRLTQKAGDTITPPFLSALQGSLALPLVAIVLPIIYLVQDKITGKGKKTSK